MVLAKRVPTNGTVVVGTGPLGEETRAEFRGIFSVFAELV